MSQNIERFGVEAVWLDAKFEKGVKDYNDSMKRADQTTKRSTRSMSNDFKNFDRAASASFTDAAAKVLVWARTVQVAFAQVEQAAQARGQREALQSLAASYGVNAGEIIQALRSISGETLSVVEASRIANRALLAGGASFAAEIPRLFEIARAAAVATGQDVNFVFDTLIKGVAKGSPLLIDNAELYLSLGDANERYAASLGKSVQELTRQEKTQATLNAVLEQGAPIVDQVGRGALEATGSFQRLRASATNLKDAWLAAATQGEGFGKVLNFLSRGLEAGAQAAALFSGGFAGLISIVQNIDDLIRGTLTLDQVLDQAAQTGLSAFAETAEALGVFVSEEQAAVVATDELAEATAGASAEYERFADTIEQAQTGALEQLLTRAIAAERQLEDAALARARKIEDIERQTAQRRAQIAAQGAAQRAQIEANFVQTLESLQAQAAESSYQRQIQLNRQLEEIERRYQERRRQINQQFAVNFQRAVRSRDALALVEAVRTRERELQEARNQRNQERNEAQQNYNEQEQEQQRSLQRQIEEARRARAQQLVDLAASLAEQEQNLRDSAEQQLEDFDASQERKRQDQERAAQRQLQDQQRQFRQAQIQAQGEYLQNESLYRNHLERMLALTNAYIPAIFGGAPQAYTPGVSGPQMLAEGGAFVVNQPTQFVAGEAGPEVVIAQPLSQVALPTQTSATVGGSVRHDVSGAISAQMAGFEGRLTAEINQAVLRAFREVLR